MRLEPNEAARGHPIVSLASESASSPPAPGHPLSRTPFVDVNSNLGRNGADTLSRHAGKAVERFVGDLIPGGFCDRLFDAVTRREGTGRPYRVLFCPCHCTATRPACRFPRDRPGMRRLHSMRPRLECILRRHHSTLSGDDYFGWHHQLPSDALRASHGEQLCSIPCCLYKAYCASRPNSKARHRSWQPWCLWRAPLNCRASSPNG